MNIYLIEKNLVLRQIFNKIYTIKQISYENLFSSEFVRIFGTKDEPKRDTTLNGL
jgi:hypothetical protein